MCVCVMCVSVHFRVCIYVCAYVCRFGFSDDDDDDVGLALTGIRNSTRHHVSSPDAKKRNSSARLSGIAGVYVCMFECDIVCVCACACTTVYG